MTAVRTLYQPADLRDFAAAPLGPLTLVNADHPLPTGFALTLARPLAAWPEVWMEAQAAKMLAACLRAAGAQQAVVPVSGWRARAEQQAIWDDTLAARGAAFTRRFVARPGCSEHETGLAIDLAAKAETIDFICPDLPRDGVYGAFRRAAARYGFIERYRADKQALTGIAAEPWHFRYVGAPHAQLMEQKNLCLEEYIALLADGRPLRCTLPNGRAVTVRRAAAGQELPPAAGPRQLSGDNAGGVIVTDWEAPL